MKNCQNWESGLTMPNSDQLLKLSKIFNISIDELIENMDFIPNRNLKANEATKKDNNRNKQYKNAMVLAYIASALFFLAVFVACLFISNRYLIALGFAFIGISILWFGISFIYKKKYLN
ncbi:MAG: helix-turn-helix domain-containing protein [Anaeroplasma sp.]